MALKNPKMNIYERLLEKALSQGRGRMIDDVRLGLGYTAVKLDSGQIGLGYTILEEKLSCNILPPEVSFAGKPADVVAKYFLSANLLEAGVGLATINAILNNPREDYLLGDPLKLATITSEDRVAMVGYFEPLAQKLRNKVAELWIFERNPARHAETLRESDMFDLLPQATVAIITSVTLINKTLEEIFEYLHKPREVILLGPSTPLFPEAFRDTPITILSGLLVKDEKILTLVSEAKGTKAFKPYVEKVNLRLE
ncbi:hypothetical protein Thein_0628 [Thermodesulfatator indicus DSM 15286]|uniref:Heavy-metal chelation domain-containing protein n=1 Tax=Thermodesulfatator indicus (strain DSM 15286 / JCM 11887 / CIR29812) TaxID=667014 RepID=F8ABQ7_THEID|nr:DUF364 domain-containing protein [Thermodesulfatator indicus]AEH44509.1 hypothetical protein Thein_0628 [Thermodesulfatator indicus DSM 15286]